MLELETDESRGDVTSLRFPITSRPSAAIRITNMICWRVTL